MPKQLAIGPWRVAQEAQQAQQDSRLDTLEQAVAALQALQEPKRLPMLLGAATTDSGGAPTEASFEALEQLVGKMGIRRTYETSIPATFASSHAGSDVGKRASWVSVKTGDWAGMAAGKYDGLITPYVLSVPEDHRLMLTWQHEPCNDGGDPVQFVAGSKHFYTLVKALRPDILVGPIFIGWTWDQRNAGGPGVQAQYCLPLAGSMDFAGLDPYNTYHLPPHNGETWDEAPLQCFESFLDWTDSLDIPAAIGETACAVDTTHGGGVSRKVAWINKIVAVADASSCLAFCYFDTDVNGDLDPSMLLEAQPESIDCWSALVAAHATSA